MPTTMRHKRRWTLGWLALALGAPLATALYVTKPAADSSANSESKAVDRGTSTWASAVPQDVDWVCVAVPGNDRGTWPGDLETMMSPEVMQAVMRLPPGGEDTPHNPME